MVKKVMDLRGLLFIFLTALCWGPSYAFIKTALHDFSPLTITFTRIFLGYLILHAICMARGLSLWKRRSSWKHFLVLGFLFNIAPLMLISYSEMHISSSLAGILNSFVLIFTAILSHFFVPDGRLTGKRTLGIGVGILGLVIIYLPMLFEGGVSREIGVWLMIGATAFYGLGSVYARTHLKRDPSIVVLAFQLGLASILVFPFMMGFDQPLSLPTPALSSVLSLVGLGVIGAAGGFFFYYRAIHIAGPMFASLALLLVPVIAMIVGAVFMGDDLAWPTYIGVVCILSGILLINPIFQSK